MDWSWRKAIALALAVAYHVPDAAKRGTARSEREVTVSADIFQRWLEGRQ